MKKITIFSAALFVLCSASLAHSETSNKVLIKGDKSYQRMEKADVDDSAQQSAEAIVDATSPNMIEPSAGVDLENAQQNGQNEVSLHEQMRLPRKSF